MKKVLLIISLFVATNAKAQKIYKITEIGVKSLKAPNFNKIEKTQMTINISDNLFTVAANGESFSYQVVKKVNEKSFTISDGENEYGITIGDGVINHELEAGLLTYFF